MCTSENNLTYILILRDDLSGYFWLTPTAEDDSITIANVLVEWFASFGVNNQWLSDRGSHFKSQVIEAVWESLNTSHHFTIAYFPCINGGVELVCRELLRGTQDIMTEF